jgi:glycosyltransferase involved in cell wall biosynthesis
MRVAVDGFNLALPTGTGVASYARELARTLREGGHEIDLLYGLNVPAGSPTALRETLFYSRLAEIIPGAPKPKLTLRQKLSRYHVPRGDRGMVPVGIEGRVIAPDLADRLPPHDRLFTRRNLFDACHRYFRKHGRFMTLRLPDPPAIAHWTYPLPIRLVGAANVYTIHDLVPLRLPHTTLEDKSYHAGLLAAIVRDAAHVCTVSDSSRNDIIDLLDAAPDRVTNTYQSSDVADFTVPPAAELAPWLERVFGLNLNGYYLFVGAIEPKKNVGKLIEAYLDSGVEAPLLIVGSEGWRAGPELAILSGAHGTTLAGAARVRRIPYLPRATLLRVLAGARALLFPSLYEGFGLPVLEAMTLGVPVLTATTAALPEIAGDAALLADPYDTGALARAIAALDADSGLRERLGHAGKARSRMFAREPYRERIEQAYARALL